MKKRLAEVLQITIYIWMVIQVLMGAGWIVRNLGKLPDFHESKEILTMSATLCVDEYTGYLYPLVMRIFTTIAKWINIPAYSMVYILQLLVAYLAYEYFFKQVVFVDSRKKGIYRRRIPIYVLFVLSIPTIIQVHMSVLSYSLASSLYIVLLARILVACRGENLLKVKNLISMGLLWILSTQFCVDYVWICGISVIFGVLVYMHTHKCFCWRSVLMIMISILCIGGLNATLQTQGSMGKIQKSPESVLLTRVVWPKFAQLSSFWGEEVKAQFSDAALMGISTFPEKVIYEFGPQMDKELGYEAANNLYKDMVKKTLEMDTKYVITNILKDGGAYLCPPLTMYLQLHGVGSSYTGWNYGRMKDHSPRLTDLYVEISLNGWIYLMIISVVLYILGAFPKEWKPKVRREGAHRSMLLCFLAGLVINVYYVMASGHMQDYKKVLVISALWAFGMISVLNQTEERYYLR